jgi:hypothetical protein
MPNDDRSGPGAPIERAETTSPESQPMKIDGAMALRAAFFGDRRPAELAIGFHAAGYQVRRRDGEVWSTVGVFSTRPAAVRAVRRWTDTGIRCRCTDLDEVDAEPTKARA